MSNFDEIISQFTAKIKLLPVSEKGRPAYWNFTSGFDFIDGTHLGRRKSTCIPNFN